MTRTTTDNPTNRLKSSRLAGVLAVSGLTAAIAAIWATIFGWRGVNRAGLDWLEAIRVASATLEQGHALPLSSPHPALDAFGAALAGLTSAQPIVALGHVATAATAATIPAVWLLASRIGGSWAGVAGALLYAGLPSVTATATTTSPAALVLLAWAWFLALSCRARPRWPSWLAMSSIAALLSLSWPPFILWVAPWLAIAMLTANQHEAHPPPKPPGYTPSVSLPLGTLAPVIAAFAAPLVLAAWHPGDLLDALGVALRQGILPQVETIRFAGENYTHSRPPLITGLTWWATQTPALVVSLTLVGIAITSPWLRRRTQLDEADGQLPWIHIVSALVFLLVLPWLQRARHLGGVDPVTLAQPIASALAGTALVWALAGGVKRLAGSTPDGRLATLTACVVALFTLPGFVQSAKLHPLQGSNYNLILGGVSGAQTRGYPSHTDAPLPIEVARELSRVAAGRAIEPGPYLDHLHAYLHAGLIGPVELQGGPQTSAPVRLFGPEATTGDHARPFKRLTWQVDAVPIFEIDVITPLE